MFKLKSERLLQQLSDAISRVQNKKAGAVIRAGRNLDWVVYHEFGTATRFQGGDIDSTKGIEVTAPPSSTSPSGFYPTPGSRLPITSEFPKETIVPINPKGDAFLNPGVTPKGMIQTALPETISPITQMVAETLLSSNFDIDAVETALVEQAAPLIVEAVAERIGASLGNTERDTPGRLNGESPADAFSSGVEIEPLH